MKRTLISVGALTLAAALWLGGPATGVVSSPYGRLAFTDDGLRIECTDGSCLVPLVVPWSVSFPDQGAYDAVITATFDYRTSADVRVVAKPRLAEQGQLDALPLSSGGRRIPPSTRWNTATVSWLAEGLSGAITYDLTMGIAPAGSATGSTFIEYANALVTVEASPAPV